VHVLVARAQSGEELAWERLFQRSYPRLLAYATRRLASPEQASDAVGEAMTRAVAGLDRFRLEGGGFDAWMYGILRHVVADIHRAALREGPGPVPELADDANQPDVWTLDREDAAELRAAFAQLDASDRELLQLRVVDGLSAEEVADRLGRRPGAVRMAQSRALARLRAFMEADSGPTTSVG
jgi:RNA polymerase sigma-70 factor (ECF subfamily)